MAASKKFLVRALLISCGSVFLLDCIVPPQIAIGFGQKSQINLSAIVPGTRALASEFTQSQNKNPWVGSWSCSPVPSLTKAPPLPPGMNPPEGDSLFSIPPPVTNSTVRMIVRGTAGGDQVRIRVSNFYGKTPLQIGAAHIALREAGSGNKSGKDSALKFRGQHTMDIPH